ncbi:MAG: SDR family oxidoreductase [Erysipelotrichaceae bacterium]|nr:SDR family oxidoreductase [Erysipelotrichaceae bacterium]
MSDKESIDKAFSKIPQTIDKFFGVAGLKGATLDFMYVAKINLVANKYICEEILVDRINDNGAIAIVSSAVGVSWEKEGNYKFYKAAVEAKGLDETVQAIETTGMTRSNNGFAYVYTKLATNYLVAYLQNVYGGKHIRVNALMPGDTATNFGKEDGAKVDPNKPSPYVGYANRTASPKEMAYPLIFLNSDMASFLSGTYVFADYGCSAEVIAGIKSNLVGESIESNILKAMKK